MLPEHKQYHNAATNAISENARGREQASSLGKREYGGKQISQVLVAFGISTCYGQFSLGARFENHEPFISYFLNYFRTKCNCGSWSTTLL
jgi:hypothetical protein